MLKALSQHFMLFSLFFLLKSRKQMSREILFRAISFKLNTREIRYEFCTRKHAEIYILYH